MLTVNANRFALSPAMVVECLVRCERAGRPCTEIWISDSQLKQYELSTLGGRPLMAAADHDCDSLLFADADGTILELHDLATPILASISASRPSSGIRHPERDLNIR